MYSSNGGMPVVSYCYFAWSHGNEGISRLWESPGLGMNHLGLTLELMDLIPTRGCECTG